MVVVTVCVFVCNSGTEGKGEKKRETEKQGNGDMRKVGYEQDWDAQKRVL